MILSSVVSSILAGQSRDLATLPLILATKGTERGIHQCRHEIYKCFGTGGAAARQRDGQSDSGRLSVALELDSNLAWPTLRRRGVFIGADVSLVYCINICRGLRLNLPRYR